MTANLTIIADNGSLRELREELRRFSTFDMAGGPLGRLGINQCFQRQGIRNIDTPSPAAMFVVDGIKELATENDVFGAKAGEILLVPGGSRFHITNSPDQLGRRFLAISIDFDAEVLRQFRQTYGGRLEDWDLTPRWHSKSRDSVTTALAHWLNWSRRFSSDVVQIRHRQIELLLLLAQEGLAGNLLLGSHPSWKWRVHQLISMDPARSWRIREVCTRLVISESSLRRRLQLEGITFRQILEDVRLAMGLGLVMSTSLMIFQIAGNCGYQSQSRFTERFKNRYGIGPSELRKTQLKSDADRASNSAP